MSIRSDLPGTLQKSKNPAIRLVTGFLLATAAWFSADSLFAGGSQASGAVTDQMMVLNGSRMPVEIGDYVSASVSTGSTVGLNDAYRFFIEVPDGLSRLVVELFDPDILVGTAATENTNDRDLRRNSRDSFASYRLFDPDGNLAAGRFGVGDDTAPNADNSWITLYDSETAGVTGGDTFADDFDTQAYNNSTGNTGWATDWIETNELSTAGPTGGQLQVTSPGGELQISNVGDSSPGFTNRPSLEREVDLATGGYSAAVLSFDWRVTADIEVEDSVVLEISDDGGTTWDLFEIFRQITPSSSGSRAYDLTDYMAANTRIRFRVDALYAGANEAFLVDDLQIRANTLANGGAPTSGHWELVVDMSSDIHNDPGEQDELNAFAMRAHDGTSGPGGTEVNVYALSFFSLGLNNNGRTRSYNMYPYVTEGCTLEVNDFDFDSGATDNDGPGVGNDPPYGSWDLTSRSTAFTDDEAGVLSDNNLWASEVVTGWNSDNSALEYGIWDLDLTISDFGSGNYAVIYLGNQDAADPDANADGTPGPSASPEADTFRIYFPTDANAAPAKPYVTQTVRYTGPGNGPNPPVMGSTSRFAVTVTVVNPTGSTGDITFSAPTHVVTAHVPGDTADARVRYGGLAGGFPTAGTVTEPTVADPGGGDVVWNPGTIAPGDTEVLVYFVDVEPLVATSPLTVPVTGGYSSADGTRAIFVDETGDTSDPFTFGNLCGLNIIAGGGQTATPVLVSDFRALAAGGSTLVQWQTAAEAGTVAYDLLRYVPGRRHPEKINREPLVALLDAPQGGTYQFLDHAASVHRAHTYELVEIEATGRRLRHGPFSVQAEERAEEIPLDGYGRVRHQQAPGSLARPAFASPDDPPTRSVASDALKIITGEPGLYRVSAQELAAGFGLGARQLPPIIRGGHLRLTHLGQEVAWNPGPGAQSLEFFAQEVESLYTGENVYRLHLADGRRMDVVQGEPPRREGDELAFRDRRRFEENLRPLVLAPIDPESDIWFWDFLSHGSSQHGEKSFGLSVPGVSATSLGTARLEVQLQGTSVGQHAVEVELNGQLLGTVALTDFERASTGFDFDHALLGANNTVRLLSTAGGLVFVDAFELDYDRQYLAEADRLLSRGDENALVAVGGFGDGAIRVFDLAEPDSPRLLRAVGISEERAGYRAIFEPADGDRPYLAVSEGGILAPLAVRIDTPSDLRSPDHTADYLILTPPALVPAAQELASHRIRAGHQTMIVRLDDVYDEFSHGLAEPPAIREFLDWAWQEWRAPPEMVVLAGAGTYDYQDFLGHGENLVPTLLRSDGNTLFATDLPYGDTVGDDGVPELIIGRIPARSAEELTAYVEKIVAYEQLQEPEWGSQVLLLADDPDAIGSFPDTSDDLGDLLSPEYQAQRIYLSETPDLATARQEMFDQLAEGAVLVSYLGHGGVDRLADEGLMTLADLPLTGQNERLPVVAAVSCHIGFHGLPGFDSLGEVLVRQGDGGAAAVWAPAWLSRHDQARFFGDRLFRHIFQNEERVLGRAVLRTLQNGAALGIDRSLLETYQLLGDPGLVLQVSPDPIPGGTGCGDDCGGG